MATERYVYYQNMKKIEERTAESSRMMEKYTDRKCVIIEPTEGNTLNVLKKRKYVVSDDMTLGNLMYFIRKGLELPKSHALIFFVDGKHLECVSELMVTLYKKYANEDGFLYIQYCGESTFGYIS